MRFQKSILLPLATFAACCSTNTMAERRLQSNQQAQPAQGNQNSAPPPGAMDLSTLQGMDPDVMRKQITMVTSKLPLPPGFTVDSMVELTMATLSKSKTDPKFAKKLQKQTGEVQKKMKKKGITKVEDLGKMENKVDKEDGTGGAK